MTADLKTNTNTPRRAAREARQQGFSFAAASKSRSAAPEPSIHENHQEKSKDS